MDELAKKLYFRLYKDYCHGRGCNRNCQFFVHDNCTFPPYGVDNKRLLKLYENVYGNKMPSFTPIELIQMEEWL